MNKRAKMDSRLVSAGDSHADNRGAAHFLCGNAVVEEGEACDLGEENGLWDEGRV